MIKHIQLKNITEVAIYPITLIENINVEIDETTLDEMIADSIGEAAQSLYPVGSLYFSTTNTNPSTFITGTTWEQYGKGQMLRNAGTITDIEDNEETFELGDEGGEYNHTITIAEMTEHKHQLYSARYYQGSSNPDYGASNNGTGRNLSYAGKGVARNNTQPSITCYIWRRLT